MGGFKRFLQRINPFDNLTYSQWDRKYLANFYAGSKIYTYKGSKYMIRPNGWAEPLFLVGQNLNITIGKTLTTRDITDAYTILFSNSLDVQYSDNEIKILAGFVGAVEKSFILTPNYDRPDLTIQYWGEFLGVPEITLNAILKYAVGRQGQKVWLNGVICLMTINHIGIQNYLYDIESNLDFIANRDSKNILGKTTQPDPNINPATGQPYGFGSVDLETGEIKQDGVIIKPGMDISQLKRVITNDPNQSQTSLWPWLLVIGGAVLLRKKKRKNK